MDLKALDIKECLMSFSDDNPLVLRPITCRLGSASDISKIGSVPCVVEAIFFTTKIALKQASIVIKQSLSVVTLLPEDVCWIRTRYTT